MCRFYFKLLTIAVIAYRKPRQSVNNNNRCAQSPKYRSDTCRPVRTECRVIMPAAGGECRLDWQPKCRRPSIIASGCELATCDHRLRTCCNERGICSLIVLLHKSDFRSDNRSDNRWEFLRARKRPKKIAQFFCAIFFQIVPHATRDHWRAAIGRATATDLNQFGFLLPRLL